MRLKSLKLPRIKLSKKTWLITAAAILAGLVVAYSVYSWLSWRDYQQTASSWIETAQADLDQAIHKPIGDGLTAQDKRRNLVDKAASLHREADGLCQPPSLTSWQVTLGPVRQMTDDCHRQVHDLNNRASQLDTTMQFLSAEVELAAIIKQANQDSVEAAEDDADWQSAQQAWGQAVDRVDQLDGGAGFEAVQTKASQVMAEMEAAWQDLQQAHQDRSEADFQAAQSSLDEAYAQLDELGEAITRALQDLL